MNVPALFVRRRLESLAGLETRGGDDLHVGKGHTSATAHRAGQGPTGAHPQHDLRWRDALGEVDLGFRGRERRVLHDDYPGAGFETLDPERAVAPADHGLGNARSDPRRHDAERTGEGHANGGADDRCLVVGPHDATSQRDSASQDDGAYVGLFACGDLDIDDPRGLHPGGRGLDDVLARRRGHLEVAVGVGLRVFRAAAASQSERRRAGAGDPADMRHRAGPVLEDDTPEHLPRPLEGELEAPRHRDRRPFPRSGQSPPRRPGGLRMRPRDRRGGTGRRRPPWRERVGTVALPGARPR